MPGRSLRVEGEMGVPANNMTSSGQPRGRAVPASQKAEEDRIIRLVIISTCHKEIEQDEDGNVCPDCLWSS